METGRGSNEGQRMQRVCHLIISPFCVDVFCSSGMNGKRITLISRSEDHFSLSLVSINNHSLKSIFRFQIIFCSWNTLCLLSVLPPRKMLPETLYTCRPINKVLHSQQHKLTRHLPHQEVLCFTILLDVKLFL